MGPDPENQMPAEETPPPELPPAVPKSDEGGAAEDDKPAWTHRGNGKIARLPKAVRDQINQMLLDGVPYAKIAESIGEPGKDLNDDNLGNWKKKGFQDWLMDMQRAEDLGATREAALSLVEQKAGATVQDAGRTIASAQLYELLLSFDPRGFADAVREKPELYFRLVNALSRLSEGEAVCSRRRAQGSLIEDQFNAAQNGDGAVVIPADKLNQLIRLIKLL